MYDLAIIIVSRQTRELLDNCLASVFSAEYPFSYRVVVVDNASDDGSADMVIAKHPDALIVKNSENIGFPAACNQGIRKTESRHILLLNSSAEPLPGALEAMVSFMDAHPRVGAAGCKLLNSDMMPLRSWLDFPVPFSKLIENKSVYPKLSRALLRHGSAGPEIPIDDAVRVDAVKSDCLMIRRETVNRVGLLDENFSPFGCDVDWCIRVRSAGWENYVLSAHNVIRRGNDSAGLDACSAIAGSRRSAISLCRKHYSAPLSSIWSFMLYSEIIYKWLLNGARTLIGRRDEKTVSRRAAYRELASDIFKPKKNQKRP
jgi:hypothetical protein